MLKLRILIPFLVILLGFLSCNKDSTGPESTTETVTDIDGNVYKTVIIGNQCWMAENLRVTHYKNGDAIPNITDDSEWRSTEEGVYCHFYYDSTYSSLYGCLYNYYTIEDSRGLAPEGWHVPTLSDWMTLIDYLGGKEVAGGKMKETGTEHWESPNEGATNESGFTLLPNGSRLFDFSRRLGSSAYIWSSTISKYPEPYLCTVHHDRSYALMIVIYAKSACTAVRCIRN